MATKLAFFVALLGLGSVQARPVTAVDGCPCIPAYQAFQAEHDRTASTTAEFFRRCNVFCVNAAEIEAHNANPTSTYTVKIQRFHDLTLDDRRRELRNGYNGRRSKMDDTMATPEMFGSAPLEQVDWFAQGRVVDIRNQNSCGDCWANSAVVLVESLHVQQTGELIQLSVEQAAECSGPEYNRGCEGGWPKDALQYAAGISGLCNESVYPTQIGDGTDRICRTDVSNVTTPVMISGVYSIPTANETMVVRALQTDVVSVAIDASGAGFYGYSSGIYNGVYNGKQDCDPNFLDHAVALVGYVKTVDPFGNTEWFYLLRNSWGDTTWGSMQGYMQMLSGENVCGVAEDAVFLR